MAKAAYHRKDEAFYETILKLRTTEEAILFFKDLCSTTEIGAIEQRFEVARLLCQGEVYVDIAKETGTSSATISRVNRFLNEGTGQFREILDRYLEDQKETPAEESAE